MGPLVERIELGAPFQPRHGAGAVAGVYRFARKLRHGVADTVAMAISLAQHPVRVEVGEELAIADRGKRLRGPPGVQKRVELAHVDRDVRRVGQPDRLAVGRQRDLRGGAD